MRSVFIQVTFLNRQFCIIYEQVGLSGIFLCASHIAETLGKRWSQFLAVGKSSTLNIAKTSNYFRLCPHYTGWLIMPTRKILGHAVTWKWNVGPRNWLPLRVEALFTLLGGEWHEHLSDTVTIHFYARSSIVPAQKSCQSKRLIEQKALPTRPSAGTRHFWYNET